MDSGDHGGATVDTSRPFNSVKEAVAVFGERFSSIGDTTQQNRTPVPSWRRKDDLCEAVWRLQRELEETKNEVMLLKEREPKTEMAASRSLGEILSIENGRSGRVMKERKHKPVIPLLWEMFKMKKGSHRHHHLHGSVAMEASHSHTIWN